MTKPRVYTYLAGPMSGLPEWNVPAFRAAANRLRALGFLVLSPVEIGEAYFGSASDAVAPMEYLRLDLEYMVRNCSRIALLPGWERSIGARCEVAVAITLGFAFYAISDDEVRPIDPPHDVHITHGYSRGVHLRLRQEGSDVARR